MNPAHWASRHFDKLTRASVTLGVPGSKRLGITEEDIMKEDVQKRGEEVIAITLRDLINQNAYTGEIPKYLAFMVRELRLRS